jgi:hypothetical protein
LKREASLTIRDIRDIAAPLVACIIVVQFDCAGRNHGQPVGANQLPPVATVSVAATPETLDGGEGDSGASATFDASPGYLDLPRVALCRIPRASLPARSMEVSKLSRNDLGRRVRVIGKVALRHYGEGEHQVVQLWGRCRLGDSGAHIRKIDAVIALGACAPSVDDVVVLEGVLDERAGGDRYPWFVLRDAHALTFAEEKCGQ